MNINHKISKSWQNQKTVSPNLRNPIITPLLREPDLSTGPREDSSSENPGTPDLLSAIIGMSAINPEAIEREKIFRSMCHSLGLSPDIEIPIYQMIEQIQKTVPGAQISTIRKIKYPKGLTPQIAEMEGNGIRNRVLGNILGDGLSESEFDSLIQSLRESHKVVEIESVVSVEKSHIRILGQTDGPFKEIYEILTLNI